MTPKEREKLIEDMCRTYYGRNWDNPDPTKRPGEKMKGVWRELYRKVLPTAEAAFAKEIEAAYKEGWRTAVSPYWDPSDWKIDWRKSKSRAAILASIPEKKDERT